MTTRIPYYSEIFFDQVNEIAALTREARGSLAMTGSIISAGQASLLLET